MILTLILIFAFIIKFSNKPAEAIVKANQQKVSKKYEGFNVFIFQNIESEYHEND